MVNNYLFDLDGTLTDSREGITNCIVYALEKLNIPIPDQSVLNQCIGPSLKVGFSKILNTQNQIVLDQAIALYRDRFSTVGLYENQVYPGIKKLLQSLTDKNCRLFVATSKPTIYSKKIITHFHLDSFFQRVYGSELDGTRADKTELIRYILEQEQIDPKTCLMIGDRKYDIIGAKQNHMQAVGVLWGYGSRSELETANADRLCKKPSEIKTPSQPHQTSLDSDGCLQ